MTTYTLELRDAAGNVVSTRQLQWTFDGIGRDNPNARSSREEFEAAMITKGMYRDAAYAAGKWPFK